MSGNQEPGPIFFGRSRWLSWPRFQQWSVPMSCLNLFESSYPTTRFARDRTQKFQCSRVADWISRCIIANGAVVCSLLFTSTSSRTEPFWKITSIPSTTARCMNSSATSKESA
eukprot:s1047_g21.t1